jgi:ferrochelatase
MADRAILLLNLGGPETPADVKPFLYRLFVDPEIIRIRFTPARALVAWLIATLREKKSKALYAQIGGGSPIRRLTDEQASALEASLKIAGRPAEVRTAFTCSRPLVEEVVKDLAARGVKNFLALPLYPQYSFTTTKGSLDRVRQAVKRFAPGASLQEIRSYPTQPDFLAAHADLIQAALRTFPNPRAESVHLLFSAHSIPEKLVTELGDTYKQEVEASSAGIVTALGWKGPWSLAWQSRLGPVKWLEPSTVDALRALGAQGVRQVLVVPVAFVTDHIETLSEIDIEFKEVAEEAGIKEFRRTPGLNAHPLFIKALAAVAAEGYSS